MNRSRNTVGRQRTALGMTLIEIMVVLAIIGLIMGGIGIAAYRQFERARLKTAYTDAVQLATVVEQYRIEHRGKCPANIEALHEAKLAKQLRADPWGNAYEFTCQEDDVVVRSAGPDRESGTDDDIVSDQEQVEA